MIKLLVGFVDCMLVFTFAVCFLKAVGVIGGYPMCAYKMEVKCPNCERVNVKKHATDVIWCKCGRKG